MVLIFHRSCAQLCQMKNVNNFPRQKRIHKLYRSAMCHRVLFILEELLDTLLNQNQTNKT